MGKQLISSGTSVSANIIEAKAASSKGLYKFRLGCPEVGEHQNYG